MKRSDARCVAVILAALAGTAGTSAQPVGPEVTYQGELRSAGTAVAGPVDLRFLLFREPVGGGPIAPAVDVPGAGLSQGRFTQSLNFGAGAFGPDARYLEIQVRNPAGSGAYVTLTPRQLLTAAPVAQFALNGNAGPQGSTGPQGSAGPQGAQGVAGVQGAAGVQGPPGAQGAVGAQGAAGVQGAQGPAGQISLPFTGTVSAGLNGALNITNTNGPAITGTGDLGGGVRGFTATGGSYAVFGRASASTGSGKGGWFQSSADAGMGVYGEATSLTGVNYGVYGRSASPSGYGVYGDSADNMGVYGLASGTSGVNYGVYGDTLSTSGIGVRGRAQAATGVNYGGYFATNSGSGYGVFASANGTAGFNYGVFGTAAGSGGYGVYGSASSASGQTHGGYFQASSTSGRAVEGAALASSGSNYGGYFFSNSPDGVGVFASSGSTAAGASYGVYALSGSSTGEAVSGLALASTGAAVGVHGTSYSISGRGVLGEATAATGTTYGVQGTSQSTSGRGVFGWATAASGSSYGVYGRSDSPGGVGVRGYCSATTGGSNGFPHGVFGEVLGDIGSGVYGLGDFYGTTGRFNNAVTGFGVFSFGTSGASGAKTFRIDHPDDPENKYLLHYSSESPECLNFYSGTAVLDNGGNAVVDLPRYFAKVNKDPRYQLTAVGAPMPLVHVAAEISSEALETGAMCSFRIGGGVPGGKVSWRVEAVRNDLYMQHYGAPVEVEKRPMEKGTYQHPELYGKPIERRVDYAAPDEDRGAHGEAER